MKINILKEEEFLIMAPKPRSTNPLPMFRSPKTGKLHLSDEEKRQARSGELKPSTSRYKSYLRLFEDGAINEFLNRSNGQLRSPSRPSKKKRRKKKSPRVEGIPLTPPPRKEKAPTKSELDPPSANAKTYLDHIRSISQNFYSKLLNKSWGNPEITYEGYKILNSLPATPTYSLRLTHRIFAEDSWQNIPRLDRKILFSGCLEVDFRSLHFEIFMMLLRKYEPNQARKISDLLGGKHIWEWFENEQIEKSDAKRPIQMVINCKSARATLTLLSEPERLEFDDHKVPDGFVPTRVNIISESVKNLVNEINRGRNSLTKQIEEGKVRDAFENPLPRLSQTEMYYRTDKWKPIWTLVRTDLNTLYASYELKLMTDLMVGVIRGYDRFKVVLHLHDGVIVWTGSKYSKQVRNKLTKDSKKILREMDIQSELCLNN